MKTYEYELYRLDEGLPLFFHDDMVIAGDPANYCAINWHENVELLRISEGEGRVMVGEKICPVGVGDIIVIPADRLHTVTSDTTVKYSCLILDHEYLGKNGLDISRYDFPFPLCDDALDRAYTAVIQAYFAHVGGEKFADVAVRGAVLTLAADLCRRFGTTDFAEDNSADVVKQVIRIIRKHLAEPLTLDDLADRVGISKYHLTRQFRRYTGSTVITFLNRTRCDHARHLLLTEQCTVGEAAELSGFSNLSYFTRTFRRHIGCLPSECRRE